MSVILRTAGIDRSAEELEWDLNNLLAIWEAIKTVVVQRTSPFLIYRESDSVVRALRDYLTNEIGEILIDDPKAHDQAKEFIEQVMPHNLRKLKLYEDPVPLFTRYQIESQIESAFAHQVTLPSGGSMVIDHTEALVSIDINSARATKGGDIEATALQTNLEAADEVGRQLRLRDLGGLVVIDFIDMGPQKHQREVEARLRDAVRQDRARVQIGKISRFGLLEMSRQRLRPSLGESSYLTCPRCSGVGTIRSVESLALAILRIIGEEARKERTAKVIAQLPVEVATYLLNEKRDWVQGVEERHKMQVVLVANTALETPHYVIRRVRDDQLELPENMGTSYELKEAEEEQLVPQAIQPKKPAELPAVASRVETTPPPPRREPSEEKEPGLLSRIFSIFASAGEEEAKPARRKSTKKKARGRSEQRNRGRGENSGDDSAKQTRGKKSKRKRKRKSDDGDGASDAQQAGAKSKKQAKKKRRTKKKTAGEGQADTTQDEGQEAQDGREPREKRGGRRRSRGGRRRRKSKETADAQSAEQPRNEATPNGKESDKAPTGGSSASEDRTGPKSAADSASPDSSKPASVAEEKQSKNEQARSATSAADAGKAAEQAVTDEPKDAETKISETGDDAAKNPPAAQTADSSPGSEKKAKRKPRRRKKAADDDADSRQSSGSGDAGQVGKDRGRNGKSAERPKESETPGKAATEAQPSKAEGKDEPGNRPTDRPKTRLLPWEPQDGSDSSPTEGQN